MASMYQYPFFLVLLDLRKAYDTLEFMRFLHTMERYGAVPKLCGFLE